MRQIYHNIMWCNEGHSNLFHSLFIRAETGQLYGLSCICTYLLLVENVCLFFYLRGPFYGACPSECHPLLNPVDAYPLVWVCSANLAWLTLYQITVAAGSSCCLHYDIMLELEIVYTAILNKNSLYFVQYFMINSEQITPIKVQIIKSSNKRNSFYFF